MENHLFCRLFFFSFFFFILVILIMFVLKEIEVHDGTVGGGVNFLLFLLASLRIETVTWAELFSPMASYWASGFWPAVINLDV